MAIFTRIDNDRNIIKGLIQGDYVFNPPKKPNIMTPRKDRAKKQSNYDNLIAFYPSLDDWNTKGFDTLTTFFCLLLDQDGFIDLEVINLKNMIFQIKNGSEILTAQLFPRTPENSHPRIIVEKGNVSKEYICDNRGKEGLIIDLISMTINNNQKSVTRSYNTRGFFARVSGLDHITEISISKTSGEKTRLLNEEEVLMDLLASDKTISAFNTFELLNLNSSDEMAESTVGIKVFSEPDYSKATESRSLIERINIFRGALLIYESAMATNPKIVFKRTLCREIDDYSDIVNASIKEPSVKTFFIEEQDRCEKFIEFLNKHAEQRPKELKYADKQE